MKEKAVLDIDGVLANFYLGFAKHLNENLNAELDLLNEPHNYKITEWNVYLPETAINAEIPKWILSGGYKNMPIYPGAKEFVYRLMDKYDIYVVTARIGDFTSKMPEMVCNKIKEDTNRWFKKYGIPSDKLFFEHKKIDFCKDNGISIIIEDKLSTVIDSVRSGITPILMNRNWNSDLVRKQYDINIAYNYEDVLNFMEKITNG